MEANSITYILTFEQIEQYLKTEISFYKKNSKGSISDLVFTEFIFKKYSSEAIMFKKRDTVVILIVSSSKNQCNKLLSTNNNHRM